MAVQRVSRSFKDISLSFQPHPVTGDIGVIRNESAINRSVRNIIETNLGEKPFDPDFGADIRSQLFELCDYGTASILEDQILTALQNHEPRINNIGATVEPFPDTNTLEVTITYNIIGQEFPAQTFTFILEATR
jgi:phage baseplate assembly protein W